MDDINLNNKFLSRRKHNASTLQKKIGLYVWGEIYCVHKQNLMKPINTIVANCRDFEMSIQVVQLRVNLKCSGKLSPPSETSVSDATKTEDKSYHETGMHKTFFCTSINSRKRS
jgi:hypothetical protein